MPHDEYITKSQLELTDEQRNTYGFRLYTTMTKIANDLPDYPVHTAILERELIKMAPNNDAQSIVKHLVHPPHKEQPAEHDESIMVEVCDSTVIFNDGTFIRSICHNKYIIDLQVGLAEVMSEEPIKQQTAPSAFKFH